MVASAGWALTTERVAKQPDGLDLAGLLDVIEAEMKDAPDRLQWAMNHCLAQIGIEHAEHRARAIDIGERLEVLKDYPTPPNCTSPFAPIWITEMVRRRRAARLGLSTAEFAYEGRPSGRAGCTAVAAATGRDLAAVQPAATGRYRQSYERRIIRPLGLRRAA